VEKTRSTTRGRKEIEKEHTTGTQPSKKRQQEKSPEKELQLGPTPTGSLREIKSKIGTPSTIT